MMDLLEDDDGAPFPESIQDIYHLLTSALRDSHIGARYYLATEDAAEIAASIAPVVERIVAARVEGVVALVNRWEQEAAQRGPEDTLYTAGVVGMLRNALRAAQPPAAPVTTPEGSQAARGAARGSESASEDA